MKTQKLLLISAMLLPLVFGSCGGNKKMLEKLAKHYPRNGETLDPLSAAEAREGVFDYGLYMMQEHPNLVDSVPIYWTVEKGDLLSILSNPNLMDVHIYVERDNDRMRLMMVPVLQNGQEDINGVQDLILPCPNSCDSTAYFAQYYYQALVPGAKRPKN